MAEDRYDPAGEAAIWQAAADLVSSMKLETQPQDPDAWNTGLEQASRQLERTGMEIRQASGMYYRPLTG